MKKLYVFDMDGTLLPKTTAMLEIAKITGHLEEIMFLEQQYTACSTSSDNFSHIIFQLWKTLSPEIVKEAFVNAPKMENIDIVLQMIAQQGAVSCMITSSQEFFARHFFDYGFDYIFASNDICLHTRTFKPELILEGPDKLRITKQLCGQLDLPFQETVAFGDSISDRNLFQNLKQTVSVNGDSHIHELAAHHYSGTDLLEAFKLVLQEKQPVNAS